jgi:hypothetical protein
VIPANGQPIAKTISIRVSKVPPIIDCFETSARRLESRASARLSWKVRGAERVIIDEGVGDVTTRQFIDVLPRRRTSYVLTAVSPFGVASTASITIDVTNTPPRILVFTSDRERLVDRPEVTLTWEATPDAEVVTLTGVGQVATRGTTRLPQDRDCEYVLRAVSFFGAVSEARLRVEVSKAHPVIEVLRAPLFARVGQMVSVSWKVKGAADVRLTPWGQVPAEGQRTMTVVHDTALTLTAQTCFGVLAEQRAAIRVLVATPPPRRSTATHPSTSLNRATSLAPPGADQSLPVKTPSPIRSDPRRATVSTVRRPR